MKGIYWLASYPKSGNTWFRVFLSNLLREGQEGPANINELYRTPMASARSIFDNAVSYDSGDLTHEEVDLLRPEVYLHRAYNTNNPIYQKVHDAYTFLPDDSPLFPSECTAGAIHIIRNPLDVCVSFAHHSGTDDIDSVIRNMADDRFALSCKNDRQHKQLRQRLQSWSSHAKSWADAPDIDQHTIRYEDMTNHPLRTFSQAVHFMGLTHGRDEIRQAIKNSSFETLKRQEREGNFKEKPPKAESFFRKGKIGSWRDALTEQQAERIVFDHKDVMRRFGYLDKNDHPLF